MKYNLVVHNENALPLAAAIIRGADTIIPLGIFKDTPILLTAGYILVNESGIIEIHSKEKRLIVKAEPGLRINIEDSEMRFGPPPSHLQKSPTDPA